MSTPHQTKQDKSLVIALAKGASQDEASRLSGLSTRTISRRMSSKAFCRRVRDCRRRLFDETTGKLADAGVEAVGILLELARSAEGESVRVAACRAILSLGDSYHKGEELEQRVAELSEQVDGIEKTHGDRKHNPHAAKTARWNGH